jgi:hypothetical protein
MRTDRGVVHVRIGPSSERNAGRPILTQCRIGRMEAPVNMPLGIGVCVLLNHSRRVVEG